MSETDTLEDLCLKYGYDRSLVYRFAETRKFNVEKTKKLLDEYMEWRKAIKLDELTEEGLKSELDKNHVMLLPGRDVTGRVCIYKSMTTFQRLPKGTDAEVDAANAYIFEQACQQMDDTFTVLLDLSGLSNRFDLHSFERLVSLLKKGFRGRLYKLYVFPCGKLEKMAFTAIKPFIGKDTIKKVILVDKKHKKSLIEAFTPETLPVHLGGQCVTVTEAPPQESEKKSLLDKIRGPLIKGIVFVVVLKTMSKVFIR